MLHVKRGAELTVRNTRILFTKSFLFQCSEETKKNDLRNRNYHYKQTSVFVGSHLQKYDMMMS